MNLETLVLPLDVSSSAFNAGLKTAVAGVTATVAAMGLAVKATFDWAAELDSIGDVMDVTNDAAAALNFTIRKSGTETETVTKAFVILNKGLVDAKGKLDTAGKALKNWGINVKDVNGNLKDQTTLINEIGQKYNELGTQQERVNFLTEVFGRSGAELIDFFDTLAADGGIDAVTQKVKELGLAIDPARYEQFNRNLEELKMIGLAVAVAFTEKIMPIIEKFTKWIADKAAPAMLEFKNGLFAAFDAGGLSNALAFIDTEVANWLNNLDWEGWGTQFGLMIDQALTTGISNLELPKFAVSLGEGIKSFLLAAVGEDNLNAFRHHFVDYILLQLDILNQGMVAKATTYMGQFWAAHDVRLNQIKGAFSAWSGATLGTVTTWGGLLNSNIGSALTQFAVFAEGRLRDVAKTFFNAGVKWANQAAQGFLNNMGAVSGAVQKIVDLVNSILKKIITSFTIKVNLPDFLGGGGGGGGGNTGGHPGTGGGGGCFIAGTLVTMADGTTKPIEEVQVGDFVRSWHKGKYVKAEIEKTLHHPKDDAPALIVLNERLIGTPEHVMYVNGDWLPLGFLKVGDTLQIDGKPAKVETLRRQYGFVPVYNLHTAHESHNYYANGILVHNAKNQSNAAGGSFMVPGSAGWEGFNLGNLGTASGGEAIRITPRGQMDTVNISSETISQLVEMLAPAVAQAVIKGTQSA